MQPKKKERKGDFFGTPEGATAPDRWWLPPALIAAAVALVALVSLLWPAPPPKPPSPLPEIAPKPAEPAKGPRVAIVIDDLGANLKAFRALLAIPQPLTFAVLPHLAHSRQIAETAAAEGHEVLLHLPMEPLDYPANNPGPGALLRSMSPEEIVRVLKEDLAAIPQIKGVNNHMGSRLTEDADVMRLILTVLKERGLFFLDSYTTPRSAVAEVAQSIGLPTASRHVFLDHKPGDPDYVSAQLDRLIAAARKHGAAIGIGHPRKATIAALRDHLPRLAEAGITVVPLSSLVAPVDSSPGPNL